MKDDLHWIVAVYFPHERTGFTEIKKKFGSDLLGVAANSVDGIAFVVNQPVTRGERATLQRLGLKAGAAVDIVHVERLQHVLDTPHMREVRYQYLGISFTDPGATVDDVERIVRRSTETLLGAAASGRDEFRSMYSAIQAGEQTSLFNEISPQLPGTIEEIAESAVSAYPRLLDVFVSVVNSADPGAYLEGVLNSPPPWLLAGPQGCWRALAETALFYLDNNRAARVVVSITKHADGEHLQYWRGRLQTILLEQPDALDGMAAPTDIDLETSQTHPLGVAAIMIKDGRQHEARAVLDSWNPRDPVEEMLQLLVRVRSILMTEGQEAEAIRCLREGALRVDSAAVNSNLSRLITYRVQAKRTDNVDADLDEAVRLGKRARDQIRRYRGKSENAVAVAADACIARHDWYGVWRLCRPAPDGEATQSESEADEVRSLAALSAAVTGQPAVARGLASESTGFQRAWIEAACAEAELRVDPATAVVDRSGLADAWNAALELADTESEKLTAIRGLVSNGLPIDETWADLLADHPAFEAELRQLAEIARGADESVESHKTRLRGLYRQNCYAAISLAEILASEDQEPAAGQVLDVAAKTFGDQNLRLAGANILSAAGFAEEAAGLVHRALRDSSPTWPGRVRAWQFLHAKASDDNDWPAAQQYASKLLGANPSDDTARWLLAVAHVNAGEIEQAWDALRRSGRIPPAPSRQLSLLLLKLKARFGELNDLLRSCIQFAAENDSDEDMLSAALQIAHIALGQPVRAESLTPGNGVVAPDTAEFVPDVDDEVLQTLQLVTEAFFDRYPNSHTGFRRITFDPENPVELIAEVRSTSSSRSTAINNLLTNNLPVGSLAAVLGRPYAEVLFQRVDGALRIRGEDAGARAHDRSTAQSILATDRAVVVEASILRTLVVLMSAQNPSKINQSEAGSGVLTRSLLQRMLGAIPGELRITDSSQRDLSAGYDALSIASDVAVVHDRDSQGIRLAVDADGAAMRRRWASDAMSIARLFRMIPSTPSGDPRASTKEFAAWIGVVETARAAGVVLWSDDYPLRDVARALGVPACSSLDLFEALSGQGVISTAEFYDLRAGLVACGAVDIDPTFDELMTTAQSQAWLPGAVALILSSSSSWHKSSTTCVQVLAEALARMVGNPDAMTRWLHQACVGFLKALKPEYRVSQMAEMLKAVALQRYSTPALLNSMLDAVRGTAGELAEEIWGQLLRLLHRAYLDAHDEDTAARLLLLTVQACPQDARQVALRVILGRRP